MTHENCSSKASPKMKQSEADEMTETEAIRLAQKGDAVAFERIFRLHSRRVYALCLRMVRNTAEAEDLTQEAFLQLFRKIHTFRRESAFSTWLHRVSVNVVLMHMRKKTKNTMLDTPLERIDEEVQSDRTGKEIDAPDPVVSGSVARIDLDRAIGELPPGYKRAFMLHDVDGYEHHEISEILGCSVGNSKSQLHKARKQLRNLLQDTLNGTLQSIS
jgi:RNA polymerase sigma-70 factor (ECF subfamily)